MKKSILIFALAISIISCDKKQNTAVAKEFKTAYVDTSELMKESTEAKDIKAKYEAKAEVMGSKLKLIFSLFFIKFCICQKYKN